jgi:outer membrane protein insertion porin family/translocation and assembly module TamA
MRIARAAWLVAALLSTLATTASAQRRAQIGCDSDDDIEVRSLNFIGNRSHTSYSLERGVATTASTWWRRTFRVFGQRYCLDSLAALVEDSARLDYHYKRTGFPDVKVKPVIRFTGPKRVAVEYRITEGEPMLLDSVSVVWEPAPPDSMDFMRNLPVEVGDRFSITDLEAGRDTLRRRLLNNGYPEVEILRNFDTRPSEHRANVQYVVIPGPKTWIGQINIPAPIPLNTGQSARISAGRVRDVLGVKEGDLYNESALEKAERGLFDTEAFRYVGIEPDTTTLKGTADSSTIDIDVALHESTLSATRASLGWANLDCLRAQVNHTNYNALGGLRRLDLNGRVSKVGTSYPTEWAQGFCTSELLNDEVSDTLNYYLGGQVSQAALFGLRIVPTLLVYTERRSEFKAYLRDTKVGVIASAQQGLGGRLPMTWSYQLEYGKTSAQPAFFCAVFNVCEAEARERLERYTRSAVVGWAATRTRAFPNLVSPVSGNVMRVELRHASPFVGATKDASFNRATFDGSWYRQALGGILVTRLRAGAVLGTRLGLAEAAPTFIPLTERLYAGGPNSVRGFRQNEMGPAIYVPDDFTAETVSGDSVFYWRADPDSVGERTVPSGGDNVFVMNAELRMRSPAYPELVQYALFVDAGQVWNRGRAGTGVNFADIRVTPGIGLRVFSPVGPIRMDVGYNPYRRTSGPAYVTETSGNLICVSPGNTLEVRIVNGVSTQQDGDCPATYTPKRGKNFWNRLTFSFSIGQPF